MNSRDVGYMVLGAYLAVLFYCGYKWIDNRLNQIQLAARTFPSVEPPKSLSDLRRESAKEFIATLREEGLIVTEA